MRRSKTPSPPKIANYELDLSKDYDENWAALQQHIQKWYSYDGIYQSLLNKSFPLKSEQQIPAFSRFWVKLVAYLMYWKQRLTAQAQDKLLLKAKEKLDAYWFDTATHIQRNLVKTQVLIDQLEESLVDIEGHIYELKDIDPQTTMHEQEIYGMSMRFEMELELCKARLALAQKSKQQLLNIKKAYEVSQKLERSRQKLQSLEARSDQSLAHSIEVNAQVEVLRSYVLMIEEAQEDAEQEEDYQKVLSLEAKLAKINV